MDYYKVPDKTMYVIVNFTASVVLSLLSYNYVEQPFFRLRKKFGSRIEEEKLPSSKEKVVLPA